MRVKLTLLILACIAMLAAGASVDAAVDEKDAVLLSTGITGSTPRERSKNPTAILESADVQRLILDISEAPKSRADIEEVIEGMFFTLDDMVAVGLLREENGLFRIDFNLLRVEDQRRILEVSERLGRHIAAAFLARKSELEAIADRLQPNVSNGELFYILIGCFSLDWDGLHVTEQRGYRAGAQRTIDGRSFTPWAKEKGAEVSLKGLYWGSHNASLERTTFTTFGDHHSLPRVGLPDMSWQVLRAFDRLKDEPEARRAGGRMLLEYIDYPLADVVGVMQTLRRGRHTFEEIQETTGVDEKKLRSLLDFLEAIEYLEMSGDVYGSKVLTLTSEDAEAVRDLLELGREIIIAWHESSYAAVKAELSDLTPVRNGVPFERVYTEIWHFVFAIANRTLVEEGFFADPYAEGRHYKGFIPAIWAKGLGELP